MSKQSPAADSGRGTGSVYSTGPGLTAPSVPSGSTPTAADYYASNRGGGLFSEAVSQRIGAQIAVVAHKHGLAPSVLTVANLGIGCIVSAVVIATAGQIADGAIWGWAIGLLALLGWQAAYA